MDQTTQTVSNEEIMEFLKKFYSEFQNFKTQTENRFLGVENKFSSFESRLMNIENKLLNIENKLSIHDEKFEIINTRLNHLTSMVERQEESIKEIWQDRKELKLGLTKSLLTVTGVLSGAIAIVISLFTGKAIIYSAK